MLEAQKQEKIYKILQECEWRFEIDGLPTIIPIKDRGEFMKEVVQYYVTLQYKAMMDQMILGLQHSYQVLSNWHVGPGLFFFLLQTSISLTLK